MSSFQIKQLILLFPEVKNKKVRLQRKKLIKTYIMGMEKLTQLKFISTGKQKQLQ